MQRDDLADPDAAERTFAALPRLYPASILRDDALWELARTRGLRGDTARGCATQAQLRRDFPDSKYGDDAMPTPNGSESCPRGASL